jgi:hypothetical protein
MVVVLVLLKFVVLAPGGSPLAAMFIEGAVAGLVAIFGIWRGALHPEERKNLLTRFGRIPFIRRQAA